MDVGLGVREGIGVQVAGGGKVGMSVTSPGVGLGRAVGVVVGAGSRPEQAANVARISAQIENSLSMSFRRKLPVLCFILHILALESYLVG